MKWNSLRYLNIPKTPVLTGLRCICGTGRGHYSSPENNFKKGQRL